MLVGLRTVPVDESMVLVAKSLRLRCRKLLLMAKASSASTVLVIVREY